MSYVYGMVLEHLRCEVAKEQVRVRPHSEERMGRLTLDLVCCINTWSADASGRYRRG